MDIGSIGKLDNHCDLQVRSHLAGSAQLRRDIGQLRTEQDFLRSELVAMRLDMNEIQGTLARAEVQAQQPQAAQQYVRPVSPQHSEAMLLAGRGVTAAQIADHCGISVAEAELVCALARAEDGA